MGAARNDCWRRFFLEGDIRGSDDFEMVILRDGWPDFKGAWSVLFNGVLLS